MFLSACTFLKLGALDIPQSREMLLWDSADEAFGCLIAN